MAKQKLFPKTSTNDDKQEPHDKFSDLASKVVSVPKAEIDKREEQWQNTRKKR
jgi:hypothetical protein